MIHSLTYACYFKLFSLFLSNLCRFDLSCIYCRPYNNNINTFLWHNSSYFCVRILLLWLIGQTCDSSWSTFPWRNVADRNAHSWQSTFYWFSLTYHLLLKADFDFALRLWFDLVSEILLLWFGKVVAILARFLESFHLVWSPFCFWR